MRSKAIPDLAVKLVLKYILDLGSKLGGQIIWLFLVPSGNSLQQRGFCQVEFWRLNTSLILLDLRYRVLSNCANLTEVSGSKCSRVFLCSETNSNSPYLTSLFVGFS